MSRNTRKRRLERKNRPKLTIEPSSHEWGEGPPLTSEERRRALSRFSSMTHRGTTIGFTPLLANGWVRARTSEELEDATRDLLEASSTDEPSN